DRAPGRPAARPRRVRPRAAARRRARPHHPEPASPRERGRRVGAAVQPGPPERAVLRRGPRADRPGGVRVAQRHRRAPGAAAQLDVAVAEAGPSAAALEPAVGRAADEGHAGRRRARASLRARPDLRRSQAGPRGLTSARVASRAATAGAAVAWVLFCIRWFDVARPLRPAWLERLPAAALAAAVALLVSPAVARLARVLKEGQAAGPRGGVWLVSLLAIAFRLPLAWHGAAAYVTADGALSGIVALRARYGAE